MGFIPIITGLSSRRNGCLSFILQGGFGHIAKGEEKGKTAFMMCDQSLFRFRKLQYLNCAQRNKA
jgi:hypothetical protein